MADVLRVHIKNIPADADERSLKEKYSDFGEISDVVLKNEYGFFSIKIPVEKWDEVVDKMCRRKWNGRLVTVSKAKKDNFIARLAKEREESKNLVIENSPAELKNEAKKPPRKKTPTDYSLSNNEEIKLGIPAFRGTRELGKTETKRDASLMESFEKFDSIWQDNGQTETNVNSFLKSKKKYPVKKEENKKEKHVPHTKLDKKRKDDERRRQTLADKDRERKRQQDLIRSALSDTNAPKSKKIVFDADDTTENKRPLFEDDNFEEIDIPANDHLDEEKGAKLLKLQAQFSYDDRFKMDERFLDPDDDKPIDKIKNKRHLEMVRFDPNKKPLEKEGEEPAVKKPATLHLKEKVGPVVSKEKYYHVSDNIKKALAEKNSGFSLLAAYGNEEHEMKIEKRDQESPVVSKQIRKNPMIASDSSESENEEQPMTDALASKPPHRVCSSDRFFFVANDPLFSEAMEFINKKNSKEAAAYAANYDESRRTLRRIFKDQALRRAKKDDMFKKKLGGMKKPLGKFGMTKKTMKKVKTKK